MESFHKHSIYINSRYEVGEKETVRKVTVSLMTTPPMDGRTPLGAQAEHCHCGVPSVSVSSHRLLEGRLLAGVSVILVFKDRWFLHKIAPKQTSTTSIVLRQKKQLSLPTLEAKLVLGDGQISNTVPF